MVDRPWQLTTDYQRHRNDKRLRPWQVDGLFFADYQASSLGYPLIAVLSINWTETVLGASNCEARLQKLLKLVGKWLDRRGLPKAWLYVHENPEEKFNSHVALHLPASFLPPLEVKLEAWVGSRTPTCVDLRKRYGKDWSKLIRYLAKGTDFMTAVKAKGRARRQGIVEGKRCGWTRNLADPELKSGRKRSRKVDTFDPRPVADSASQRPKATRAAQNESDCSSLLVLKPTHPTGKAGGCGGYYTAGRGRPPGKAKHPGSRASVSPEKLLGQQSDEIASRTGETEQPTRHQSQDTTFSGKGTPDLTVLATAER